MCLITDSCYYFCYFQQCKSITSHLYTQGIHLQYWPQDSFERTSHLNPSQVTSTGPTSWDSWAFPSQSTQIVSTVTRGHIQFCYIHPLLTYHRIPPRRGREALCPAALVAASCDVVENLRVGVCNRVDEADGALLGIQALLVDECEDRRKGRRAG